MRVAAYIRVSTSEQAEKGNSLREQEERLRAYCKVMDWNEPILFDDDGYSAGDLKRPNMQRLIKRIKENEFDILITTKIDRLSRTLLDLLQMIDLLDKHKCAYVSATESFDTSTAAGRMVLQLLGVFAEFERARISERVHDNMVSVAKNTNKALSYPCFGYDIKDGIYVINEEEAKIIRMMVEMVEAGHGTRAVAIALNAMEVKTKKGYVWDSVNVRRLLRNPMLKGTRVWNKTVTVNGKMKKRPESEHIYTENNHPAIIEPEHFKRLQDILITRGKNKRQSESATYLLSGILKCGHCGGAMHGATSRHTSGKRKYEYFRYRCSTHLKSGQCVPNFVHRDPLEKAIVKELERVANTSAKDLHLKIAVEKDNAEAADLKTAIKQLDAQLQRQIEAYAKGLIDDDALKTANERVKEEKKLLQAKLSTLESRESDVRGVQERVKSVLDIIQGENRKTAKTEIMALIESIYFKSAEGGEIEIVWRA